MRIERGESSSAIALKGGMQPTVNSLAPLLLAALVVWCLGGVLLRLAASSCFLCAAGLLALGDAG
jgi:hypothetical protein